MKKLLSLSLIMLTTLMAYAQQPVGTFSIIPRVGMNLANLSNFSIVIGSESNKEVYSKYRPGLVIGADVEYQFSDKLAASTGLFYSEQGYKMPLGVEEMIGKSVYSIEDFKWKVSYLNMPIMLHGSLFRGLSVNAGVQLGYCLSGTGIQTIRKRTLLEGNAPEMKPANPDDFSKSTTEYNIKESTKAFDVSIPIGLSYEFSNIIIDARYNIGLTNTNKLDDDKMRNRVFMFTLGYRFAL